MFADKVRQKSDRTMWAEYRDGFMVCLRHVTREELRKMVKRATVSGWDSKTHQAKEDVDPEKYAKELSSLIVDWKYLTPDVLRSMIDLKEYPDDNPYSARDAEALVKDAYDFDAWVQTTVTNIDIFAAYEAAETKKKSGQSLNGASVHPADQIAINA